MIKIYDDVFGYSTYLPYNIAIYYSVINDMLLKLSWLFHYDCHWFFKLNWDCDCNQLRSDWFNVWLLLQYCVILRIAMPYFGLDYAKQLWLYWWFYSAFTIINTVSYFQRSLSKCRNYSDICVSIIQLLYCIICWLICLNYFCG